MAENFFVVHCKISGQTGLIRGVTLFQKCICIVKHTLGQLEVAYILGWPQLLGLHRFRGFTVQFLGLHRLRGFTVHFLGLHRFRGVHCTYNSWGYIHVGLGGFTVQGSR